MHGSGAVLVQLEKTAWKKWKLLTIYPPDMAVMWIIYPIYMGWMQWTLLSHDLHRGGRRFESCSAHFLFNDIGRRFGETPTRVLFRPLRGRRFGEYKSLVSYSVHFLFRHSQDHRFGETPTRVLYRPQPLPKPSPEN